MVQVRYHDCKKCGGTTHNDTPLNNYGKITWTCMTCGRNDCYVTVHHIKSFSLIIKEYNIKTTLEASKCPELISVP